MERWSVDFEVTVADEAMFSDLWDAMLDLVEARQVPGTAFASSGYRVEPPTPLPPSTRRRGWHGWRGGGVAA